MDIGNRHKLNCFMSKLKNNDIETFIAVSCTVFYLSFELMGLSLTIFSRIALCFRVF